MVHQIGRGKINLIKGLDKKKNTYWTEVQTLLGQSLNTYGLKMSKSHIKLNSG